MTKREPAFHTRTSKKITGTSEISSTFIFAVFTSVLPAPDEVFGERTVLCNDDDVVFEPAVQVTGERTQDVRSQAPSLDQEREGCVRQLA